ncbi:lysophospholipid acyltransferase family protein [Parapedobacter sp. ISTM3]|uniref:Putative hemolysin n=1 Tax=Parapedobacter luteus TaxID=623280 RepID=A0A1T5A0E5_9SPHI|nr:MULTISPECIES: GNAT family N-acyltransferase [Parapedobacter]MBK1438867.1 lysophospholipid acyltransferase family protein [Parapedobacter sp. ISTM3]SKB28396.1 Putative hemolysin [Parapedobacter luteus]
MEPLITKGAFAKATGIHRLPLPGIDSLLMSFMQLDRFNTEFDKVRHLEGAEFVDGVLELLGIQVRIDPSDLEKIPKKGSFIAVANHPYGGIEGLILLKILCAARPETKVVANFLLQHIPNLSGYFIGINPFHEEAHLSNVAGLRQVLAAVKQGMPVAMFPAGEVSAYQPALQQVTDKRWHPVVGKLLAKAGVPIVPIYFHGHNGLLFNLLGMLHPKLRTARLAAELFNKHGHEVHLRIGMAISPEKIAKGKQQPRELLDYVRARTYALGMDMPKTKWEWLERGRFTLPKRPEDIVSPVPVADLEQELAQLQSNRILTAGHFDVFLSEAQQMPRLIREIGRLREVTFRGVGEGSNRSIDLDVFDLYYRHLFIWDRRETKVVGAYRVGMGAELLYGQGKRGFYLSQLFKMDKALTPVLKESMELGRSWIREEYQQTAMPLYLLWKGIAWCLEKYPQYRYLIGPVSISGDFSRFSRSVIVEFIRRNCYDEELAALVRPRKRFKPSLMKMDLEALLDDPTSLNALERLVLDIEKPNRRFPVLLRHYLSLKASIIAFNVDPKFNHCLDGFLVFDRQQLDEAMERRFFGNRS